MARKEKFFLKRTLMYLHSNKNNDMNMRHSDVEKYVYCRTNYEYYSFLCAGSHRRYGIHYSLRMKTEGRVFPVE